MLSATMSGDWTSETGTEEPKLKWEHITTLTESLEECMRVIDRKSTATTLSKLKLELGLDSHSIGQGLVALFGLQANCLDSITRKAV